MRALPIINKVFNLFSIISLIVGMGSSIPCYSTFSSWEDDLSESSKSEKITGNKRLRDSSSDSGEPDTKRPNLGEKEERESISIEENLSIYSSKDYNSAEENSGSKESLKLLNVDSEDVFYIFNVGQGNSQLAVYSEELKEPFGVLYDCGSSAKNVHPKIAKARSNGGFNIFLRRNKPEAETDNLDFGSGSQLPATVNNSFSSVPSRSSSKGSIHKSSITSSGNISYDADREDLIDTSNFIKQRIVDHNIKYLFVILSHPDKDHINFVPSVIPKGVKSILLLCGDFLQKSKTATDSLKAEAQSLFKFFSEESNHVFSLPYYWNFSKYKDIKTSIKNYAVEEDKLLLTLSEKSQETIESTPSPFYGSLHELISLMDEKEEKAISSYWDTFLAQQNIKEKLDNIYVWSLNRFATDVNDQSIIVSFRMPSLGKSFICTGDAREDVFVDIYQSIRNQEKFNIDKSKKHLAHRSLHNDKGQNTVILMLPHHGSLENTSFRMLDLFKPDVLAISAGAGMYPHPSNELLKNYKKKYKFNSGTTNKFSTNIWQNYGIISDFYYLSFKEKTSSTNKNNKDEKKVDGAFYKNNKEKNIPILCTNTLGTIKITKDNFESEYINLIKLGGNYYKINLSEHEEISDEALHKNYKYMKELNLEYYIPLKKEKGKSESILIKIIKTIKENNENSKNTQQKDAKAKKQLKKEVDKKKVTYYYKGIKVEKERSNGELSF